MSDKWTVEEFLQRATYEGLGYALSGYFGEMTEDELYPHADVELTRFVELWNSAVYALQELEAYIAELDSKGLDIYA